MSIIPDSGQAKGGRAAVPSRVRRALPTHLAARLAAAIYWLERAAERRRGRRALRRLNDDQLRDIGLSRADAHREATRPFWE